MQYDSIDILISSPIVYLGYVQNSERKQDIKVT
jgi:hypothetical protein